MAKEKTTFDDAWLGLGDLSQIDILNNPMINRTKDDIVSKGLKLSVPFGKLQEYKLKATDKEKEHRELHMNLLKKENPKSKEELKKMKWNDKALYAHHLHHFSDRVLDPLIRKSKK